MSILRRIEIDPLSLQATMTIIVSKGDDKSKKYDNRPFPDEAYLQDYIHKNPDSIPLYEIDEDIKALVVGREFPTNSGPIDALAIDGEGGIYIIETKLYKNPDKRTVVAQALDYGASLWKRSHSFDDFISKTNQLINKEFKVSLEEKFIEYFEIDEDRLQNVLDNLKRNLDEGIFKFVVLMDHIDERLKDLILFVNQNSQFDIYPVEFKYYKVDDYQIIIPKIYGIEVKKSSNISSPKTFQWDESTFFEKLKERGDEEVAIAQKIYSWAISKASYIWWGKGSRSGSFVPMIIHNEQKNQLFAVWTGGTIEIYFQSFQTRPPFDSHEKREELLKKLNGIDGVSLAGDVITRRPNIPLKVFSKKSDLNRLTEIYDWVIEEFKTH